MSKSKKRNSSHGQKTKYRLISQSAYEGRHTFKAAGLMMAAGLSLSAVIATMPQTVCNVITVKLDGAAAPAYVTEISDTSEFYTNENLVNFTVPEIDAENREFTQFLNMYKPTDELASFVSAISDEEAEKKLEEIEAEKAAEAARKAMISSANASGGYTRLNASGRAMSEKVAPDWLTLDENGIPTDYAYCITGKSTAYYSGYITSTGTRPMQGTVAVDPREIPYGTKMYITSADGRYIYGYAVAEDTGGFIYFTNGATVDLYMHSYDDCVNWGWRSVNIYVLG